MVATSSKPRPFNKKCKVKMGIRDMFPLLNSSLDIAQNYSSLDIAQNYSSLVIVQNCYYIAAVCKIKRYD